MLISGGKWKGRRIKGKTKDHVRPTSQLVRQALFNILKNTITDAHFIDCFAGSGLVGIESMSRGASRVTFVEKDGHQCRSIKQNCEVFEVADRYVINRDVFFYFKRCSYQCDIIFFDPPYPLYDDVEKINILLENSMLICKKVVVFEHPKTFTFNEIPRWTHKIYIYGDTALSFFFAE
ncbi:16S rRNA (guanine(966)-N(2))-methyltransferase RsmD [Chlamydiia bacterium]|nr:16S rRNA (guanine(966)-N(2))-methyltransferase RsmD [Chlamydiia bacterium]